MAYTMNDSSNGFDNGDSNALVTGQPQIVETPTALEQVTRGEVDMQVATAKRWPRSVQAFKQNALAMALKNPQVAAECFFALPRGGKKIEGPSIRLAEIVAVNWGNLRCETRIVGMDDRMITAQATAWDIQTNVLIRRESQRRITDRAGRRYNDDMIVTTGNAAAAIALRNAIFTVVPMAYVKEIYDRCKQVAAGERGSLDQARKHWIAYFAKLDVTKEQVVTLLDRNGVEEIDIDDIATLQGVANAIAQNETTVQDAFPSLEKSGKIRFGFRRSKSEGDAQNTKSEPDEPADKLPSVPKESSPAI